MTIVELAGGLGNQMFQYAFGLAVARRTHSELVLDHRFIERRNIKGEFTYRDYELDIFDIRSRRLQESEYDFADGLKNKWSAQLFHKCLPIFSTHLKEDQKRFRPDYFWVRSPIYIQGYFQNPRYLKGVENQLREDFDFQVDWSMPARRILDEISSMPCPVSLHIRRGDYLQRPELLKSCDDNYYRTSIDLIRSKHKNLSVVVFTDDPGWVKTNFSLPVPMLLVDSAIDGFKDHEDMRLMSLCNHHVIANSSFSWWGAWLGRNSGKIVCAPSRWDGKRRPENIVDAGWRIITASG